MKDNNIVIFKILLLSKVQQLDIQYDLLQK